MTRTISISTDVFAAIWARRTDGEETEDAILRRVLGLAGTDQANTIDQTTAGQTGAVQVGFSDTRHGVTFPEGFEAIRRYKRVDYRAVATNGSWLRADTGEHFPSLNQLNASFLQSKSKSEDVWRVWQFKDSNGSLQPIEKLRP